MIDKDDFYDFFVGSNFQMGLDYKLDFSVKNYLVIKAAHKKILDVFHYFFEMS